MTRALHPTRESDELGQVLSRAAAEFGVRFSVASIAFYREEDEYETVLHTSWTVAVPDITGARCGKPSSSYGTATSNAPRKREPSTAIRGVRTWSSLSKSATECCRPGRRSSRCGTCSRTSYRSSPTRAERRWRSSF